MYRTLGELKQRMLLRLGFGAGGAAAGVADGIMTSMLGDAYTQLYQSNAWMHIEGRITASISQGQRFFDVPEALDRNKVQRIEIWSGGALLPMWRGIDTRHYSTQARSGLPRRYEVRAQVELWPEPDQAYSLVLTGTLAPGRFSLEADRPLIDDQVVYLFALANAKAHYRHPDAQTIATQAAAYLDDLRADVVGNRVYEREAPLDELDPYQRPPTFVP